MHANLAGLATAVPRFRLNQETACCFAETLFGGEFKQVASVFVNSGIRHRYSPAPIEWFKQPHDWPERNRLYLTASVELLERAAGAALDAGNTRIDEIGAVVVVSTTGIATPSLDALLIERMGLPRTVQRLPIFGLGCAGGALGLARAATLAAAMPNKAVLFLVVELCTLSFRPHDGSKSNIVASALFGDGAAAAVLRCGAPGPAIAATGEHTWRDSLDIMGWEVAGDGLKAIFSRDIPRLVALELGAAVRDFLKEHELALSDIDRFVCHPGGPKVLAACEAAFALAPGTLAEERGVLRDFGNMSAASVLFVLERVLARERLGKSGWRRALLTALGPGFSAGFVLLSREP
ncbi:MAG: type III polyketide synthase [Alphaproteobacteria bacterium]